MPLILHNLMKSYIYRTTGCQKARTSYYWYSVLNVIWAYQCNCSRCQHAVLTCTTSTPLKCYLPSGTSQSKPDISDAEGGLDTSEYTLSQEDTSFIVNNSCMLYYVFSVIIKYIYHCRSDSIQHHLQLYLSLPLAILYLSWHLYSFFHLQILSKSYSGCHKSDTWFLPLSDSNAFTLPAEVCLEKPIICWKCTSRKPSYVGCNSVRRCTSNKSSMGFSMFTIQSQQGCIVYIPCNYPD